MERLTVPVGPLQCNCHVLWDDPSQAVVIDPGDEGERLVGILNERGLHPVLLLSTHGHFDHVGGVNALQRAFKATYRIHRADVPIIQMIPARTKIWGITVPELPVPTAFVEAGDRFEFAAVRLETLHTPGHTPGSCCFHARDADAVFTGDTLFRASIGRTDFPGGNHPEILRSIRDQLLSLPPKTQVFPGHGPSTTIGEEAETNPFLA